jgi:hypothetical protein
MLMLVPDTNPSAGSVTYVLPPALGTTAQQTGS